jgi:predicted aconitase with swiveling domain
MKTASAEPIFFSSGLVAGIPVTRAPNQCFKELEPK